MARTRNPEHRIAALLEAGTSIFRQKGFNRTQMSDVAAKMGVSSGTLYNYVDSKEALFEHVIVSGFNQSLPDFASLPLTMPTPGAMEVIKRQTRDISEGSGLDLANQHEGVSNPAEEIKLIVTDFFVFFAAYHPTLEVIESSWLDYPDLNATYQEARIGLVFAPWTDWVNRRIAEGIFRTDIDAEWTVRYLIEMLAWGAWKARSDEASYDENKARDTMINITLTLLLKDEDRK